MAERKMLLRNMEIGSFVINVESPEIYTEEMYLLKCTVILLLAMFRKE